MEDVEGNEVLSEQVRIMAPIFPAQAIDDVAKALYGYAEGQVSDLFKTCGALPNGQKAKISKTRGKLRFDR